MMIECTRKREYPSAEGKGRGAAGKGKRESTFFFTVGPGSDLAYPTARTHSGMHGTKRKPRRNEADLPVKGVLK